jgi:hypothetical protein
MAGLIDSDTGLVFGDGLQFQTPIGGAGLTIDAGGDTPELELEWGTGNLLLWGTDFLTWGLE